MRYFTSILLIFLQSYIHPVQSFLPTSRNGVLRKKVVCMTSGNSEDEGTKLPNNSTPTDPQDLTDRFKYKVNALMGTYDPVHAMSDNERSSGNILNAMLQFPVEYSFSVLGKTNGDESMKQGYINEVTSIVGSTTKEIRIIERGNHFVKITFKVTVDSAAVINSIYEALRSLEMTVMTF